MISSSLLKLRCLNQGQTISIQGTMLWRDINCLDRWQENWTCHLGMNMVFIIHTRWTTPSPATAQDPLGHALRNPLHMMRMWCLTPPMCWNQSVWNTINIFLDCLIHWRKSAKCCRPSHGIHARPKWGINKHGTPAPTHRGLHTTINYIQNVGFA